MKSEIWKELEVVIPLFGGTAICAFFLPRNWMIALILGFSVGLVSSGVMLSRSFRKPDPAAPKRDRKIVTQTRNLYFGVGIGAVVGGAWMAWKMQELIGQMRLAESSYYGWGYMIAVGVVLLYLGHKFSAELKSL